MQPLEKHKLCALKEYQKNNLKSKIYILTTTISIHMLRNHQKNTSYMD